MRKKFHNGQIVSAQRDIEASDYNRPTSAGYPAAIVREGEHGIVHDAYIPCVYGPHLYFHKVDFNGVMMGVHGEDIRAETR